MKPEEHEWTMMDTDICIVVDLDGTLCNTSHRQHILDDRDDPSRWERYSLACGDDTLIRGTQLLIDMAKDACVDVVLVSGRNEVAREATEEWLYRHKIDYASLFLRQKGDYRSNVEYKRDIIKNLIDEGIFVSLVIDDHGGVIEMVEGEFPHISGLHVVGRPLYKGIAP